MKKKAALVSQPFFNKFSIIYQGVQSLLKLSSPDGIGQI
jgi:hypothetical protein